MCQNMATLDLSVASVSRVEGLLHCVTRSFSSSSSPQSPSLFFLTFLDMVLLCSPCWPGPYFVAKADLKLTAVLLSHLFSVLGLIVRATSLMNR